LKRMIEKIGTIKILPEKPVTAPKDVLTNDQEEGDYEKWGNGKKAHGFLPAITIPIKNK